MVWHVLDMQQKGQMSPGCCHPTIRGCALSQHTLTSPDEGLWLVPFTALPTPWNYFIRLAVCPFWLHPPNLFMVTTGLHGVWHVSKCQSPKLEKHKCGSPCSVCRVGTRELGFSRLFHFYRKYTRLETYGHQQVIR